MNSSQTKIKLAIQKSGRLSEDSQELLKQCGIKINFNQSNLIVRSENTSIDILRVRDDDIPSLVMDGVVDIGIAGENVLAEEKLKRESLLTPADFQKLCQMDFGTCRLSLVVPNGFNYQSIQSLNGSRIATSYPYLLKSYMKSKQVDCDICFLNGSVEVAPRAGVADAICDLVSTGGTLEANDLKEVEVVYRSKAALIQSTNKVSEEKQQVIDKFLSRIQGVTQARGSKYIMLHALKANLHDIVSLLPGAERPTILPLVEDDSRVAVHMVSKETLFWETMEALKSLGASSILVLPIEKMME